MSAVQHTVIRDGFELTCTVEGSGVPVLVMGSSRYYPRAFSMALRDHLRLAFADHRGFAPMPAGVDPDSIELATVVDDFEAIRAEVGFERMVVMGHSGHAYMALEYAKRYPQHVSHLVMIGIAPSLGGEMAAAAERHWQESVDAERKAVMADNLARWPDATIAALPPADQFLPYYLRNGARAWYYPRFDATGLWQGVVPNAVMLKLWSRDFAAIDIAPGLADLPCPVLLALGRFDYVVAPPHSWEPYRPLFADLTVRVFNRSGHTPCLEEAAEFDAELLAWLAR